MNDRYTFRRHAFATERTYRLGPEALHCEVRGRESRIAYHDVGFVRVSRRKSPHGGQDIWRLHLYRRAGFPILLSPLHYEGFSTWEDRSAAYVPFAQALAKELRRSNPGLRISTERRATKRLRRAIRRATAPLLGGLWRAAVLALRNRDPARAARLVGGAMRWIGPRSPYHRVAHGNLTAAFPQLPAQGIDQLLDGMWDNFGRQMAEYIVLDRLWDHDLDSAPGRIVIDASTVARLEALRGSPALFFTAHLANWELPCVMLKEFGIEAAWIYRPRSSATIEADILRRRTILFGRLIAARPGAAAEMVQALRNGASIGMLVDQHFVGGVDVQFFGRTCKANPTLARLARQFESPIHGLRAIRLPEGRFRLEMTNALAVRRDGKGRIGVAETTQMITWKIEEWVREHPEQWFWMHRRWR